MAGLNSRGPNFPPIVNDGMIYQWMWWRWKYSGTEQKWNVDAKLDSPFEDTPGLIYHTPSPGNAEPDLTNDWWWIPHVTDPTTGVITTHGKLHVRDTSNIYFNTDPNCESGTGAEWQEIELRTDSDPSIRGERGKTIWADYGPPEQNLLIDGSRPAGSTGPLGPADFGNNWSYTGDVDDLIGDLYVDLGGMKLYGPKFVDDNQQAQWGDGISILGPAWARWRGKWDCNPDNVTGYLQAPHDIVSHIPYDKAVRETWLCTQDHVPSCDADPAVVLNLRMSWFGYQINLDSGKFPMPCQPDGQSGADSGTTQQSAIIFWHTASVETGDVYKYFFTFQPHKFDTSTNLNAKGEYWDSRFGSDDVAIVAGPGYVDGQDTGADGYYTGQFRRPSDTDYPQDEFKFDPDNPKHTLIEIKLGGPKHSHFRVAQGTTSGPQYSCPWTYDNSSSGSDGWFTTDYTGLGGDGTPNQQFDGTAWFSSCVLYDYGSHGQGWENNTPGYWEGGPGANYIPERMTGNCIMSGLFNVIKQLKSIYEATGNWNTWLDVDAPYQDLGVNGHYGLQITSYGAGSGQNYPKFYGYTYTMPFNHPTCSNEFERNSANICGGGIHDGSQWGFYSALGCGGNAGLTMTMDDSQSHNGSSTIWEPHEGSPYWEKLLGVDHGFGDIVIGSGWGLGSRKRAGCEWHLGGFEPIVLPAAYQTRRHYWRDFKTFDQLPGCYNAENTNGIKQGVKKTSQSDPTGPASAVPFPDQNTQSTYKEWGMGGAANRWIRTVGRDYRKNPIVGTDNPQDSWTGHGDVIRGSGGSWLAPIPCHWVCLKPGNKYQITIAAWIKPQFFPIMPINGNQGCPVTWQRNAIGGSGSVPDDPLDTFNNGWFDISLWNMPDQAALGTPDPNTTIDIANGVWQAGVGNDPSGPWYTPYNTVLRGIGSPKNMLGSFSNANDNDLIVPSKCISYLSAGFTKEDLIEHDNLLRNIPAGDSDMIRQYKGSVKPVWDGGNGSTSPTWQDPSTTNHQQFNARTRGTFVYDSFVYSPSQERDGNQPGDCWIGLYYDAHWWGPMVQSFDRFTYASYPGQKNVGTIGFFPDSPIGRYEGNPEVDTYSEPTTIRDMLGGLFRIEILEDND